MISGISITLITKTQMSEDPFHRPVYVEAEETVHDVLVGEPVSTEVIDAQNIKGRKITYTLGIPKGDTHTWEGMKVRLPAPFEGVYNVVGISEAGIEANIPLRWNKKVQVERYG